MEYENMSSEEMLWAHGIVPSFNDIYEEMLEIKGLHPNAATQLSAIVEGFKNKGNP